MKSVLSQLIVILICTLAARIQAVHASATKATDIVINGKQHDANNQA